MNKCHCQNQYYYSCHHLKDSDVFSQGNLVSMFVNDYNSLTIIPKKKTTMIQTIMKVIP